jgi:hypothetical protein
MLGITRRSTGNRNGLAEPGSVRKRIGIESDTEAIPSTYAGPAHVGAADDVIGPSQWATIRGLFYPPSTPEAGGFLRAVFQQS